MITVYDFINKLNTFYPSNEKEEIFRERQNEYANSIIQRAHNRKEKYDYDKVFSHILQTYKFKTFPSLPDILEALPFGIVVEESYSGKEGEVIKRIINGMEYEFTIVPNHWDKVKTISELDREIEQRLSKEIA